MSSAVVIGSADCVWNDYQRLPVRYKTADIIAVNKIAVECSKPLAAWCSLHGEFFPTWLNRRRANRLPDVKRIFTGLSAGDDDVVRRHVTDCVEAKFLPHQFVSGSSGLFAVKVALIDLGYEDVVLCGVPMTATPHFDDNVPWPEVDLFKLGWEQALPQIDGRVRSMSGWTRELLGAPNEDQARR